MDSRYAGMTTNERLFEAGLLDAFDRAARARDREEMTRLLKATELPSSEAARIVESVLANPTRYGF
ncbi:MAG TPA: hypothetical protein VHE78_02240 [Gemmatimonadaceae bacterium]|nr:hypothetical protein [Gemmatimonadaceae bacterium]